MSLNLAKVHETEKIPGTTEFRLVQVHPTASLKRDSEPPIWIQDGGIYYESGEPVLNPPDWFWEDCRKMTPERRQQLGLRLPEEGLAPGQTETTRPVRLVRRKSKLEVKPTGDKTCTVCGKTGLKHLPGHMRWAHPAKE